MTDQPYIVTIVVDPSFGNRLHALADGQPVWVVDTITNRAAGEFIRQKHLGPPTNDGITLFKVDLAESPADWVARVISEIDLHHGEYSHSPPYSIIDVIGSAITEEIRDVLASYGLATVTESPDGFRASRDESAA